MKEPTIIRPSQRVAARIVDGCALILDPKTDQLQRLNPVGSYIWSLIAERKFSAREISQAIVAEFQVDDAVASSDLEHFLTQLEEHGLIEYTSD